MSKDQVKITDIHDIDWNEVIKNRKASDKRPRRRGPESWDSRASSFANRVRKTYYSESIIRIMDPQPDWTVLDMGCGGGTIAVPLADRVSHVTAVDFSGRMIDILRSEAARLGIKNIETRLASWEEDWASAGIVTYDVALASRSLNVDDVYSALVKLDGAARKRVIISTVADDGPFDRRIFEAVGRERPVGIDYIYLYNLLYQMGIRANISFIVEENEKTFANHEEASDSLMWMFQDITPVEHERLGGFLKEHLIEADGRLVFDYKRIHTWAVLWWDK